MTEESPMITELVAKELAKFAAQKLSEVKVEDAARAIKTLRHAAGGAMLVPGLGVFGLLGLGVVIGAGVGVLIAPRSGKQTREALRDATRQRIALLRSKFGGHAERSASKPKYGKPACPRLAARTPPTEKDLKLTETVAVRPAATFTVCERRPPGPISATR